MFAQVIKGKVRDVDAIRRQSDRWRDELRPGAKGFLGSTIGVADDGTAVVVARFEDAAAAAANAARPEQGAWWEETAKAFDGEPTFRESEDTSTLFEGGSDDAGFVQVMESTVSDRAKLEAMESPEMLEQLRAARPDLLGGLRVWFGGGTCVEIAYFTSEADARKGESSEEFAGPGEDFAALFGDMSFIDLKKPMLIGP